MKNLTETELLKYGLYVFNNEKEKFERWMKTPNRVLGGIIPESLLDNEENRLLLKIEFYKIDHSLYS